MQYIYVYIGWHEVKLSISVREHTAVCLLAAKAYLTQYLRAFFACHAGEWQVAELTPAEVPL